MPSDDAAGRIQCAAKLWLRIVQGLRTLLPTSVNAESPVGDPILCAFLLLHICIIT